MQTALVGLREVGWMFPELLPFDMLNPAILFLHDRGQRPVDMFADLSATSAMSITGQMARGNVVVGLLEGTGGVAWVDRGDQRPGSYWAIPHRPSVATYWARGVAPTDMDASYFDDALDALMDRLPIDPNRVFLAGIGDGGIAAYRLAALRPERVAGIAVFGATIGGSLRAGDVPLYATPPAGAPPVSVLAVHGTGDPEVLLNGGPSTALAEQAAQQTGVGEDSDYLGDVPDDLSLFESLWEWRQHNDAAHEVPDSTFGAGLLPASATVVHFGGAAGPHADVARVEDSNLLHSWPTYAFELMLAWFGARGRP